MSLVDRLPLSDFDLGWLTAFYEGEGSVLFRQRVLPSEGKKYSRGAYLRIQFTQKDLEPLYHVRTLVAGYGRPWMGTVGKDRNCFVLYYTNRGAVTILTTVLPFLSQRRQAQAQRALDAYAARRTRAQWLVEQPRVPNTGRFGSRPKVVA